MIETERFDVTLLQGKRRSLLVVKEDDIDAIFAAMVNLRADVTGLDHAARSLRFLSCSFFGCTLFSFARMQEDTLTL